MIFKFKRQSAISSSIMFVMSGFEHDGIEGAYSDNNLSGYFRSVDFEYLKRFYYSMLGLVFSLIITFRLVERINVGLNIELLALITISAFSLYCFCLALIFKLIRRDLKNAEKWMSGQGHNINATDFKL